MSQGDSSFSFTLDKGSTDFRSSRDELNNNNGFTDNQDGQRLNKTSNNNNFTDNGDHASDSVDGYNLSKLNRYDSSDQESNIESHDEKLLQLEHFRKFKHMTRIREIIFLLVICSSQFLTLVGAVQGIPMMDAVAKTFNVKADKILTVGWCNGAYATTLGTFVILAGKLGEDFGHKFVFVFGYAWLSLWSLLAGFSRYAKSNPIFFYCCRAFQGVGAAFLVPSAITILGAKYSECTKKNLVFTFFGACAPWGIVCGLVFSSLFTQLAHWSWTYWSMGIISSLITLLAFYVVPSINERKHNVNIMQYDFLGGLFGVAGLILFSVAWNQAPQSTFHAVYVYVLLIVGVVSFIIAVLIDYNVADPFVPWKSICSQTVKVLITVFLGYLAFVIWMFYFWRYMTVARDSTLLLAAAKFTPLAVTACFAALFTTLLINWGVPVQIRMLIGVCAVFISAMLEATVPGDQIYWSQMFVSLIFIAIALDTIFPSATLLFSDGVPDDLKGISASLVATALNYATALGPPMATTIVRYRCQECFGRTGTTFATVVHMANYLAVGASGLGVLISIYGTIYELYFRDKKWSVNFLKR